VSSHRLKLNPQANALLSAERAKQAQTPSGANDEDLNSPAPTRPRTETAFTFTPEEPMDTEEGDATPAAELVSD